MKLQKQVRNNGQGWQDAGQHELVGSPGDGWLGGGGVNGKSPFGGHLPSRGICFLAGTSYYVWHRLGLVEDGGMLS